MTDGSFYCFFVFCFFLQCPEGVKGEKGERGEPVSVCWCEINGLFERFYQAKGYILILFPLFNPTVPYSLIFQGLSGNWEAALGIKVKNKALIVSHCSSLCTSCG